MLNVVRCVGSQIVHVRVVGLVFTDHHGRYTLESRGAGVTSSVASVCQGIKLRKKIEMKSETRAGGTTEGHRVCSGGLSVNCVCI